MRVRYYNYILILFILSSVKMMSQDMAFAEDSKPRNKEYYILSPRVSITVPHPVANRSFKKSFVGVYEFSGGLNVYIHKGLFAGAYYKRGFLKVMENKIPDYNAG